MCTGQIICVEEDSTSVLSSSSSDSVMMLGRQHQQNTSASSLHSSSTQSLSNSLCSNSFPENRGSTICECSSSIHHDMIRTKRSSCNLLASSQSYNNPVTATEFRNDFQNNYCSDHTISSNVSATTATTRRGATPPPPTTTTIPFNQTLKSIPSSSIYSSRHTERSSVPFVEKTSSTYGETCYGELYCYINTFISKFKEGQHHYHYRQQQQGRQEQEQDYQRKKFATTALMLPILVLNMSNAFFDHFICLFTIFVIRFAAKIFLIDEETKKCKHNKLTSSPSPYNAKERLNECPSRNEDGNDNSISYSLSSTASSSLLTSTTASCTTQHSLECDDTYGNSSKDSSLNTYNSYPQHPVEGGEEDDDNDDDDDDHQLSPAKFIAIDPTEDGNDEWGHFTDFEVDVGQSLKDSSMTSASSLTSSSSSLMSSSLSSRGSSSCGGNSNAVYRGGTIDDPFCSITKSMLRRRGHKLSVCRLEQLQENDEEEEDKE